MEAVFTGHFLKQMEDRKIKKEEIFLALENGMLNQLTSELKCKKRKITYFDLEIIVDVKEKGKWKLITCYKKLGG